MTTIMDSQTSLTHPKCAFLELPGGKTCPSTPKHTYSQSAELRNQIYFYAEDKNAITYFPRRLQQGCYPEERLENYGITKQISQYLALTQTSRQIRAEYTPIYALDAVVQVCHLDIPEFIALDFPHMAHDADGKPVGHLVVDCRSVDVMSPLSDAVEPVVDILPLINACAASPGLIVERGTHACRCQTCKLDWSGQMDSLHALFGVASRPALRAWLQEAVVAVKFGYSCLLVIEVKAAHATFWMEDMVGNGPYGNDLKEEDEEAFQLWLEDTGLGDDVKIRISGE